MPVQLPRKLTYIMSYKFYYGNVHISKLFLPRNNWDGAKYILYVLNSIKKYFKKSYGWTDNFDLDSANSFVYAIK